MRIALAARLLTRSSAIDAIIDCGGGDMDMDMAIE